MCLWDIVLIYSQCGCAQPSVGGTVTVKWTGVIQERWLNKGQGEQFSKQCSFTVSPLVFASNSYLISFENELWPWSIRWNAPLTLQVSCGHSVYHNKRQKQTKTHWKDPAHFRVVTEDARVMGMTPRKKDIKTLSQGKPQQEHSQTQKALISPLWILILFLHVCATFIPFTAAIFYACHRT